MNRLTMRIAAFVCASLLFLVANCGGSSTTQTQPKKTIPSDYTVSSFWNNASVYFVITDRFYNGNAANDTSYGREAATGQAGQFYGGDLAGLTAKLNAGYFTNLGTDVIWITAPYEQIHGWAVGGGGSGVFKHYAYHGYYVNDYTNVDKNMGDEADLQTFIDTAHAKGIRVVFDVVMNHPGYATIYDLNEYDVGVLKTGWANYTITNYHTYIDYTSTKWVNWWGPEWIRAGLGGGYTAAGTDDLTKSLDYLPDFKTESTSAVGIPAHLARKTGTKAVAIANYTPRDYMIKWLTDWVRTYGVDGFRCDTAKHVEKEAWYELKVEAIAALREWKENNPAKKLDDSDFWMTGEVFSHGVTKDEYFTDGGFNSLINFTLQTTMTASVLSSPASIDTTYTTYASTISSNTDFNVLSYISSHDTKLYFPDVAGSTAASQKTAGTLLAMCPGAIQIFYGDEYGRANGTYSVGTDAQQKTRSQMLFSGDAGWTADNDAILSHWQKVISFRHNHPAVGAGTHTRIGSSTPYTFSRVSGTDKVVVVIGASGSTAVNVASMFADGDVLTDAYTGNTATVSGGSASFTADANGVLLISK